MTTVNLLQGSLQPADTPAGTGDDRYLVDDVPSLGSALRTLSEAVRAGTVRATTPGDRWLVVRIQEALRGLDDIEQMATADEPAPMIYLVPARTASIRARPAWALAQSKPLYASAPSLPVKRK